jgi:hypothetical protein
MTITVVGALLDESGSMMNARQETLVGFNAYLEGLKPKSEEDKQHPIFFSGWLFDAFPGVPAVRPIALDVSIESVRPLENYMPRGNTPLYDAVGLAIGALETMKAVHKADKVVLMIQTDGHENSSREFSGSAIKSLIAKRQAEGWEFVFMGADLTNTYAMSAGLGMRADSAVSYDKAKTVEALRATAMNTRSFANGAAASTAYSAQQRAQAGDKPDGAL